MERIDHNNQRNLFRIASELKQLGDQLASAQVRQSTSKEVSITYFPCIMNIGLSGINNLDLVKKIGISKQGISRIIKELEKLELVYTQKGESDARSLYLSLTDEGKNIFKQIRESGILLQNEYKKVVGEQVFEDTVSALLQFVAFHKE